MSSGIVNQGFDMTDPSGQAKDMNDVFETRLGLGNGQFGVFAFDLDLGVMRKVKIAEPIGR